MSKNHFVNRRAITPGEKSVQWNIRMSYAMKLKLDRLRDEKCINVNLWIRKRLDEALTEEGIK